MNILIVDDHILFARGLKNLLEAGGVSVTGIARDGSEALVTVRKLRPNLILMDINMPGCDGLAATSRIKAEFPEIKIVMLTMNDDDDSLFEAIRNGASGYLLKNLEADELFACLEQLAQGEMVFSPGLAERVLREFGHTADGTLPASKNLEKKSLTLRQEEVLTNVAHGLTYKDVASKLGISETTVKYHMSEILERLHLGNRAQAIAYITKAAFLKSK